MYLLKKISVSLLFVLIFGNHLNGQVRRLLPDQQRLYLVLASTYYWIARDSDIDLDSCFLYICKLNNLDPQLIIQENMPVYNEQPGYIEPGEQIILLKKQLSEATGQNRITLLNAIGTFYCFQSGIKSNDLDSAFYYLTKSNKESPAKFYSSFRIQNLLSFGKYYYKRNNINSGDSCFQTAVTLSNRESNSPQEALSWKRWAMNKPLMAMNPLDRITYYGKALAIYRKLRDTANQIDCLTQTSYIQFFTRQENLSVHSSEEALLLERKIHFPYTHYNTDMLALGYSVLGKHAEFMNYATLSASTMESTQDSASAGFLQKNCRYVSGDYWCRR